MYKSFAVDGLGHFHLCKDSAEQLFLWHFPIRKKQGWEFTLLIWKSNCEKFDLVTLENRVTVSESLLSLFNMSDHEWIAPVTLYKRATVSELLSSPC